LNAYIVNSEIDIVKQIDWQDYSRSVPPQSGDLYFWGWQGLVGENGIDQAMDGNLSLYVHKAYQQYGGSPYK